MRDGTPKDGQRYVDPLLVLTGEEYQKATFEELHTRICDALRGSRPAVLMEAWGPEGSARLMMADGTSRLLSTEELRASERERLLSLANRFKETSDPDESARLRQELAELILGEWRPLPVVGPAGSSM